jgi:4-amino-4-deoxy-L-arabinose transferase-like glycosyltransferase
MATVARPASADVRRPVAWSGKDTLIAGVLVCLSTLYLWPFLRAFSDPNPDEGIILQGAIRVLQGQVPYRDFFTFYTPGSFYWNALLMKLFGDSVLPPRMALLAYGVMFSLITFVLARRMASRRASILAAVALLLCGLPQNFIVLHNWDSTAAALLALYCTVLLVERPRAWLAVVTGLFTGFSILFNQARGMGVLLGLVLGLALLRFCMERRDIQTKHFAWLGTGTLAPLIFTAVLFAASGAWDPMISCLLWPFRHYSPVNHLPYGFITLSLENWNRMSASSALERAIYFLTFSAIWLICALPIFIILVAGWSVLRRRRDLAPEHVSMVVICGAVTLGSVLSLQATRPDFFHVNFITPLFFFALPWILETWFAPFHSLRKLGGPAAVYVLIAFTAYSMALFWLAKNSQFHLQTRRGEIRTLRPNQTIPFIEANFAPGSTLLVHPYLPIYSFLTRTMTPLRYDFFQPGMHSQEQFREAAGQLAALKPPAVLFQPEFTLIVSSAWPKTPLAALDDPVADYIVHNYRTCLRLDADTPTAFLFMVRKDLNCGSYK